MSSFICSTHATKRSRSRGHPGSGTRCTATLPSPARQGASSSASPPAAPRVSTSTPAPWRTRPSASLHTWRARPPSITGGYSQESISTRSLTVQTLSPPCKRRAVRRLQLVDPLDDRFAPAARKQGDPAKTGLLRGGTGGSQLGPRAEDLCNHRTYPQRLLDHRVEVVVAFPLPGLGGQALERAWRAQEALKGPTDRRRGRLVSREQQRDQLVAKLPIGQRAALLVAGG